MSGNPQITWEQLRQQAQGDHCLCECWNRKKSYDPSRKVEPGKSLNGKGRNSKAGLHRECWYQKKTDISVKTGCSTEEQFLVYYNWKCAVWLIESHNFQTSTAWVWNLPPQASRFEPVVTGSLQAMVLFLEVQNFWREKHGGSQWFHQKLSALWSAETE